MPPRSENGRKTAQVIFPLTILERQAAMIYQTAIEPEEQTWALFAHLSGLAGYLIPFGGVIAPIALIFAKSDSPVISTIAKQALYLNIFVFLAGLVVGFITFLLYISIVGIPLAILLGFIVGILLFGMGVTLPIVGAIKAASGEYYRYPVVGQEPPANRE
jgi:uncharacterized protein